MPTRDTAPGSTATLRTTNQQRVLDMLRQGHPTEGARGLLTQADLARRTGLAPATVSNIVRDLVTRGLVETEPGSGRRGTTVRLAACAGLVAGIDFGHSHVSVALGDLTGAVRDERRVPLDPGHTWQHGLDRARDLLADLDPGSEPLRQVVLGLPAPVADGVVRSSAILPGWVGVRAAEVATEHLGLPVQVENDANLGALAEHRLGVARGHGSSVFLKISSGVGAGIVIDDRLHRGSLGAAGEVGHLTLDEQGPVCRCGSRGCLEAYASGPAVTALMAAQMPGARLDDLIEAAEAGNVSAIRAFEDAGLHLGWGLASIVNLLDPGLVVVGGDMARAGELLLGPARIGLRRHALDAVAATPVVAGVLGERASLAGAVLLAAERTDLLA